VKRGRQDGPTARTADRHALYTAAVQAPAADARQFARWHRQLTGQPLRRLREDFCGTAALAAAFVRQHPEAVAVGVDRDRDTLAWARTHTLPALRPAERARLQLRCGDVRTVRTAPVQMVVACNFSYMVFHTRAELREYLRACRRALQPGGVLLLDSWGGGLVHRPCVERHRGQGFDWLWHQRRFDPLTHRIDCRIHFRFRDGSRLDNAFVYDWRLWMLPELRELFTEAGFEGVHVRQEVVSPRTGLGTGRFRRVDQGRADPTWHAYVVGQRGRG
jgi:SAM-dependent methyltransferase